MSAVASTPVMNGNHEASNNANGSTNNSADHSPSRFTAVNGRDQSVPAISSAAEAPANFTQSGDHDRVQMKSNTPPQQEQRQPSTFNAPAEDTENASMASDRRSASVNPQKRKRSDSEGGRDSPTNSSNAHSTPRSPASKPDERVDPQLQPVGSNGTSHIHPAPESEPSGAQQPGYMPLERSDTGQTASTNTGWEGYSAQQLAGHAQLAQQIDTSDAQLAEALQRDVQSSDHAPKGWANPSHPDEHGDMSNHSLLSQDRSQPVQVGPKRKRVFSNRTKTGCMTCRRRKKKCDEQKPSCNNCLRGGFLCEGYSSRSTWQKPSNAKGPVPLQSKNGYPEVHNHNPYPHEMSPQRLERMPSSVHPDNGKPRAAPMEDNDRTASQYITSPTGVGARGSWSKGASWPVSGPPSFIPEHAKHEFREGPPVNSDLAARPDQQSKADYHAPLREMSHGARAKPGVPLYPNAIEPRPAPPPHVDPGNYPTQARLALSMEPHVNTFEPQGKTEKEKMLSGEQYRPFDPQLVKERERCKAALWRFTNAGNPLSGIAAEERTRLLKQILIPPPEPPLEPGSTNTPVGSLGPGAVVEAPFRCHYGYNINIGEDVMVSENCFFADDCTINIGAHTWIGANVTILSSMAIGSMQGRKGPQSRYQGRPVIIAEDCWIGPGSTILPGVSLGRGAYIAPGEVVKSQILPYGFQGLKPNYL